MKNNPIQEQNNRFFNFLYQRLSSDKSDIASDIKLIEYVKARGFSLDYQMESGYTLLHCAALDGNVAFAQILLSQGAKSDMRDKTGQTPYELALSGKKDEVAAILLSLKGGHQDYLDRAILAHIWGIGGNGVMKEQKEGSFKVTKKVALEGAYRHIMQLPFKRLTKQFLQSPEFAKMQSCIPMERISRAIKRITDNMTEDPAQIIEDVKQKEIVLMHTGWTEHATGIVFVEQTVAKVNTAEKQTVRFFRRKKEVSPDCVLEIQKVKDPTFFKTTIDQCLDLEPQRILRKKKQEVGNCTWASLKAIFHAILEIEALSVYSDAKEACAEALRVYKAWKYYVCSVAFREYLRSDTEKDPVLMAEINAKNSKREQKSKYWGMHLFDAPSPNPVIA